MYRRSRQSAPMLRAAARMRSSSVATITEAANRWRWRCAYPLESEAIRPILKATVFRAARRCQARRYMTLHLAASFPHRDRRPRGARARSSCIISGIPSQQGVRSLSGATYELEGEPPASALRNGPCQMGHTNIQSIAFSYFPSLASPRRFSMLLSQHACTRRSHPVFEDYATGTYPVMVDRGLGLFLPPPSPRFFTRHLSRS